MTPELSTTPLVAEIASLVDGVPGWSPLDELFALATLAYATSHLPGDLVEVGSWFGRSAVVLGAAARQTGGTVHCIDLFPDQSDWRRNADGTWSFETDVDGHRHGGYQEQTVWAEPFGSQLAPLYAEHPSLLDSFRGTVRRRGLDHVVVPHRGTAATFAAEAPRGFRCRLLFIDGDHGYRAVAGDIGALEPFLVPGGWVCFDDAFSGYEGVDRAIAELIGGNPAFDLKRQLTRKCFAARKAPRPA